jgi:FKBP-type peptidyl-prolyl cis-trans isomerase
MRNGTANPYIYLFLKKKSDMKILKYLMVFTILVGLSLSLFSQESPELIVKIKDVKLSSREDSLTYAMAILMYGSWSRENFDPDPLVFARALIDLKNGNSLMTDEKARSLITAFVSGRQAQQLEANRAAFKDYIEENEAFLAKNKERPGVIVTPSGLQYEVITMGNGPKPTASSTVKVHYTGRLIDGTEFDSSIKRNQPAQFPLSGVIPGWTEALQLMPAGSKFRLFIPDNLGYGAKGAGDIIKPFSVLIFEVELLEIVK